MNYDFNMVIKELRQLFRQAKWRIAAKAQSLKKNEKICKIVVGILHIKFIMEI